MLETDAHKAFRKKLESLVTKYEPQFPFAKFVAGVTYWNNFDINHKIRPCVSEIIMIYPIQEFGKGTIHAASNADTEAFNRACTEVFSRAYLSHKLRSQGFQICRSMYLEGLTNPNEYFRPSTDLKISMDMMLPDVTQSWIKYFEELKSKLDAVYEEIKELGGFNAVETNA